LDVFFDNLDLWGEGLKTTISLTLWSWALASVIGVVIAAFRVSPVPPLRFAGTTYVELVRNTPLTVLLALFFFGLPEVGIIYDRFISAVIVIGIYTGAFVGEVLRAGINTVAAGQAEAARALGLTFPQVLGHVVLPQAVRTVVQPLGNVFVALIRNTSIAYTISVIELTGTANRIAVETADFFPTFLAAAVIYLLLTLPSAWVIGSIERRVSVRR
jgi:glutamate transport system permease protein